MRKALLGSSLHGHARHIYVLKKVRQRFGTYIMDVLGVVGQAGGYPDPVGMDNLLECSLHYVPV